jgi:hypothetical protein
MGNSDDCCVCEAFFQYFLDKSIGIHVDIGSGLIEN